MSLLPDFSAMGFIDYVAGATGIVLGFALFVGPMNNLTDSLKKKA